MKRYLYIVITILAVCSCSKSHPDKKFGPFVYNGCPFQTLAEAVDAIEYSSSTSSPEEIILNYDVTGDGITLAQDKCLSIRLNLGGHTYTLAQGASLNVANNGLFIKGKGGSIIASSNTPAVQGWGSEIYFHGDFDLKGTNIIKSASDIYLEQDFSGELEGNVQLDSAAVVITSDDCLVTIPVLKAKGAESGLFADVETAGDSYVAKVGEVFSDHAYPITASCKGLVSSDSNVHIHNFVKTTVPGNCVTPEQYQLVCQECGYIKSDDTSTGSYGVCDPSGFIHVPGNDATDYAFGNVEYWQCPLCGKCYSDKEYLNDITSNIFIFPNEYWTIYKILSSDQGEQTESVEVISVISFLITMAVTLATSIASLVLGKKVDLAKLNGMLVEISQKVDEISQQVHQLLIAVRNVEIKKSIMDRQDDLASLLSFTSMTCNNIKQLRTKYPDDKDSLKAFEEAKKYIYEWSQYEIGTKKESPVVLTKRLLTDYYTNGVPFSKIYADFINIFGVWEHDGYKYRKAMMYTDLIALSFSFSLTYLYTQYVAKYQSEVSRAADLSTLKHLYRDVYAESVIRDSVEMHNRDSLYRVLLPRNEKEKAKVFKRKLEGSYDFYQYAKSHSNFKLQVKNHDDVATVSLKRLMNDMGIKLDSIMTATDAEFLNEVYNQPRQIIKPFTNLLIDDCGFQTPQTLTEKQLSNYFVIPGEDADFYQSGGIATYKIFCWESYKTCDHDSFGLRTMSSWNNRHYGYKKALDGANIRRRNGVFSSYGKKTDNEFFTVRMAN